jgi:hypothetical protein
MAMENKVWRNWNNFFLGLAVALLPWFGVPQGFKNVVFLLLGLLIALFSLANPITRQVANHEPHEPPAPPTA